MTRVILRSTDSPTTAPRYRRPAVEPQGEENRKGLTVKDWTMRARVCRRRRSLDIAPRLPQPYAIERSQRTNHVLMQHTPNAVCSRALSLRV